MQRGQTYRDDIVIDRIEFEAVGEALRSGKFSNGDSPLALWKIGKSETVNSAPNAHKD